MRISEYTEIEDLEKVSKIECDRLKESNIFGEKIVKGDRYNCTIYSRITGIPEKNHIIDFFNLSQSTTTVIDINKIDLYPQSEYDECKIVNMDNKMGIYCMCREEWEEGGF